MAQPCSRVTITPFGLFMKCWSTDKNLPTTSSLTPSDPSIPRVTTVLPYLLCMSKMPRFTSSGVSAAGRLLARLKMGEMPVLEPWRHRTGSRRADLKQPGESRDDLPSGRVEVERFSTVEADKQLKGPTV